MPMKNVTKGLQTQAQRLSVLIFRKKHPWSSLNIPDLPASDDTYPQVGRSIPRSEVLHSYSSAISESISVLRPLTGVIKVGQVEINNDVAESIKKVLTHLDKEIRAKLDANVRLLSNCERI